MNRKLLIWLMVFCLTNLQAQSLFEDAGMDLSSSSTSSSEVEFNGYGRGAAFGGGEQYELASAFAEISLQTKLKSREALFNSDIRLRKGMMFQEDNQLIEIKELYAGYNSNSFDLLIGNQLINWGRTDGFNPTNNITPNDYFFLTADPDDQKISNFMLRMQYRFSSQIDIDIVAVPFFKPSVYRFDLFDMNQEMNVDIPWITLPTMQVDVDFNPLALPERKLSNGSLGARLNFELPKIGFAVSYFGGYDHYHGFDLKEFEFDLLNTQNPIQIQYQPQVYKKKTIGFDMALPFPQFLLKAEAAYNIVKNKDSVMYIPNSDFRYVIGIEKMWNDYVFIVQYIGSMVTDFTPLKEPVMTGVDDWDWTNPESWTQPQIQLPTDFADDMVLYQSRMFNRLIFNQATEYNHAFALTATKSFAHDAWNAEFTAYYNLITKESILRPKLTWKVNDYLSATAGVNYMHAKHPTLFHYSSKIMNGGFIELKVSF